MKNKLRFDYLFPVSMMSMIGIGIIVLILSRTNPHIFEHQWLWDGEGNFQQDYGECRSQSLLGGWGSPDVDRQTLNALMRGRGWNMECKVCDEIRWDN